MNTLGLVEAAHSSSSTPRKLRRRAKLGLAPGAKVGKVLGIYR